MRRYLGVITAVFALGLLSAAPATAAQSAGWNCIANDVETDWTLLASGGSSVPFMPVIPPEGPKVITAWKVTVGPGLGPIRQRLEAYKPQNEEYEFTKLGESALETLVEGVNSFPTRIPVSEGNSVGLHGPEGTLFCNEGGAISWLYAGSAATGETKPFKTEVGVGTPVVVTVEDDWDSDGFGDETQDGCPVSGAFQTPCPALSVTTRREVKQKAILLHVTTTTDASTVVSGRVGWGVRRADGSKRRLIFGLTAGRSQNLTAGVTTTFRVRLPNSVQRRLQQLTPKQSLRANLFISVADVFKATTRQKLSVRLRGTRIAPESPQNPAF